MLGADVLVIQPFGFFRTVRQDTLAFVAQRQIHRSGNFLTGRGVAFDLLTNGIHGGMRTQEAVGQLLIFPQQSQQQMFRFDVRATKLAGLVSREEDDSPGFFRVSLKHLGCSLVLLVH
jgi:hypothetical protein